jgi:hypothetical protein
MMLTTSTTVLEAHRCTACRADHRFAVTWVPEPDETARPLHGFFATCPRLGRRVWFVVSLPGDFDHRVRVLEIAGAAESDSGPTGSGGSTWPDVVVPSETGHPVPLPDSLTRGMPVGGFRGARRAPELLRLALGCPHHR